MQVHKHKPAQVQAKDIPYGGVFQVSHLTEEAYVRVESFSFFRPEEGKIVMMDCKDGRLYCLGEVALVFPAKGATLALA